MSDLFRTVMSGAACFEQGDFDGLIERYSIPFVIYAENQNVLIDTPEDAGRVVANCQAKALENGVVRMKATITSQFVTDDDMAFVITTNASLDAADRVIHEKTLSYVLRRVDGDWKIFVLSCCAPSGSCAWEDAAVAEFT